MIAQGFHAWISEAEYHRDPAEQPSLSATIAKVLLSGSPMMARYKHPRLNPNHRETHDEKFDIGKAAHALFLENDPSKLVIVDAADWRTNAAKEKRDEARAAGKTPLLKRHHAAVERMVTAAREFVDGSSVEEYWHAEDAQSEVTGLWQEGPLWFRCRFDRLSIVQRFIGDYKSTEDVSPDGFARQIVRMGYHVQEAFYRRGARELGIQKPWFAFLAQSVEPPHECTLHRLHPELQVIGDAEVERAVQIWRECLTAGEWPSYGKHVHQVYPPTYLIARHEERLLEGSTVGWQERAA